MTGAPLLLVFFVGAVFWMVLVIWGLLAIYSKLAEATGLLHDSTAALNQANKLLRDLRDGVEQASGPQREAGGSR